MHCREDKCPNKVFARGWCRLHYMRWWRTGTTDGPISKTGINKISEVNLNWLAGLLEGEGCFGYNRARKRPSIQLVMRDEDVVFRAHSIIGQGSVSVHKTYKKTNHSRMYHYTITGMNSICLMNVLLPMMGERRSQKISEVLNAYSEDHP